MNFFGFTGKILDVNLTDNKIISYQEDIEDLKRFIGGMGMNCLLGSRVLKPESDPLCPENYIILGAGPLVGTITPGASRIVGLSKFPATGAIANSCGSMSFGLNLKLSGYDHIIISGKSEKPCYLVILDDYVEILDAKQFWGKDITETTNYFWKKYKNSSVIAIGQAGENLVYGALTLIDKTSTFGRGGLGAVMGSKLLKGIVVKGTEDIEIANPQQFKNLYEKQIKRIKDYPHRESWIELGMLRNLPVNIMLYAKGEKTKARETSEKFYIKKLKKRRLACPSCPMGDKDILEIKDGEFNGLITYTSSVINPFMMLIVDGIDTSYQAVKIFDLISRYGLDSLTITSLFDYLSRLYEKGILTKERVGFEWNRDYKTLTKLIEIIVHREGFGNILANGWKDLAEINQKFAEEMYIVKGLDIIWEPRLTKLGTMEFEQVVNPKGAHVASGGSPTYVGAASSIEKFKTHFKRMGIPDYAVNRIFSPPREAMGVNVGRLTRYSEDWYTVLTSLGLCVRAQMNRFWGIELVTEFYNAVTGFDLNSRELIKSAERCWNLLKLMNIKAGFSRKDDKFPQGWFKLLKYGDQNLEFKDFFGGTIITKEIADQLLDDYYDERGWNKDTGLPSHEKIKELGLEKNL
ncbi:MAG: aldehyde ferredoxin oxidoreductase N-terminal domain-containing protein [Candidatus Hodarchaeota archaeon]